MADDQQRVTLSFEGTPIPGGGGGKFEVLAISAGTGNGWEFSAAVLQESLDLWDGVEVFVDHQYTWLGQRSVRDLAGVAHRPEWDAERQGVKLTLNASGPSGALLAELGRELLAAERTPRVGFSADVLFKAKGREVKQILRVLSLDLVFNPARGGAFLRALNSIYPGGFEMDEQEVTTQTATNPPAERGEGGAAGAQGAALAAEVRAARELLAGIDAQQQARADAEEARQVRLQMCGYLLESALTAAKLPQPMAEHVRQQFTGQVFEAQELTDAITNARKLVSDLTAGGVIQGAAQISGMFSSEDQLQAAVDDLLMAPREKSAEGLRVARLSGIRELYLMLTGDREFYGGYHPGRVMLATTADFTGLVKNALNKIVANQWEQLGASGYDWWMRVTSQEHFDSLHDITGVLVGTVGALPSIDEGGDYTELVIGDSPETASFTKYGGYIPLTLELIDKDDTRKLRMYPRELAKAGMRLISSLVSAVFTSNAGVGPDMADTGALFNATAVSTEGGHANLLTTALDAAAWVAVKSAVYKQPLLIKNADTYWGSGPAMAVNPRYLLVPKDLELTAQKILYNEYDVSASVIGNNLLRQQAGDVVVVPEWTDPSDWAAVVDPAIVPGIVVGERFGLLPEIFVAGDELSPAVFTNDEHRLKVRHFVSVLVQDFRALHKSNVAG